jgi:uncharacterized FlaG/YvyC family protein
MAINVYQAYAGQPIRSSTVGDSPARRSPSNVETAPVSEVEVPKAESVANTLGAAGPESGLEAVARASVDPAQMTRAVEQANAVTETVMRAKNRSIEFGLDQRSGRVTMTIKEERNGEEVTRQIPPDEFLAMVDRLEGYGDAEELPSGTLFSLDV